MEVLKAILPVLSVVIGGVLTAFISQLNRIENRKDIIFKTRLDLCRSIVSEIAKFKLGSQDIIGTKRKISRIFEDNYIFLSDMKFIDALVDFLNTDPDSNPVSADQLVNTIKEEMGL